ncbi:MAG: hypothetical protein C0436_05150 [Alphaproteobacteria bacterium]|nr:hypothetical protein [Alphaproteobacteria bacterium]
MENRDTNLDKPAVPERISGVDKRTGISVAIMFVLLLIIFPLLVSLSKRSERYSDYSAAPASSSRLKFD